jgi:hypothetical protein
MKPQDFRSTDATHRAGLAAARPAVASVLEGTLYFATDTGELHRATAGTWTAYSFTTVLAPSVLLGRGDAGQGPLQAITLSNSLIMTGTTLSVRSGVVNYTYNDAVVAPPAAGQVRLDVVYPWTNATKIWIRLVSADGQDLYWGIMIIPVGATLLLQDKDEHARYGRFVSTGVPVDKGLYAEIPITRVDAGQAILTAQQVFLRTASG